MATHDPFGSDAERTIIVPAPGGRGRPQPMPRPVAPEPAIETHADTTDAAPVEVNSGLNPLVAAANPLLRLVPQLAASTSHADPAALRDQLIAALRRFEERARGLGSR